jgi:apolipoprotein D and lipocalin family protein
LLLSGSARDRLGLPVRGFANAFGLLFKALRLDIRLTANAVALLLDRFRLSFARIFGRVRRPVARRAYTLIGTVAIIGAARRLGGGLVLCRPAPQAPDMRRARAWPRSQTNMISCLSLSIVASNGSERSARCRFNAAARARERAKKERVTEGEVSFSIGNMMQDYENDVVAVPSIDLERYLGTWFEICRLPLRWEDTEASDITASYALAADGRVRVENRCLDKDGKPDRSIGVAVPQDESNAKLKLSFLPEYLRWIPFTQGDYWVLAIAPDYSVALVGTPDRKHLWLISRAAALSTDIVENYLAVAKLQRFDLDTLITPRQSGRPVPDEAFAE